MELYSSLLCDIARKVMSIVVLKQDGATSNILHPIKFRRGTFMEIVKTSAILSHQNSHQLISGRRAI